jgi:hypothetical protein
VVVKKLIILVFTLIECMKKIIATIIILSATILPSFSQLTENWKANGRNIKWQKIKPLEGESVKQVIFGRSGIKNIQELDANTWSFNLETDINTDNEWLLKSIDLNFFNLHYWCKDGYLQGDGIIEQKDGRQRITINNLAVKMEVTRGYLWSAGDIYPLAQVIFKKNGDFQKNWIKSYQVLIDYTITRAFDNSSNEEPEDDDW